MIRTAKIEDLGDIVSIEKESFSEEIIENIEVYKERIDIFPEGAMVIEKEAEVMGFITSEIWGKDKIRPADFELGHSIGEVHNEKGNTVYISSFALSKRVRGKGIGRLFFNRYIDYILDRYKNLERIVLIVSEEWEKARKIYKRYGFETSFSVDDFFGESVSGIVMVYEVEGR